MSEFEIRTNEINVDEYLALRASVKWKVLSREQAEKALKNSLHVVGLYRLDELIGMGRIVGDGAVICYIQDLIVKPAYHHTGCGHMLIEHLISYVKDLTIEGTEMMLDLMCAKGREDFYLQHEFIARPTPSLGPGMIQYIRK